MSTLKVYKGLMRDDSRGEKILHVVEDMWRRVKAHAGAQFQQIRGGVFTYKVEDEHVVPDRTNQRIPKSHFERALGFVPLADTVSIHDLRGPSYIYAILMDRRIRQHDY
jgi:hypothetical protein